MADKIDKRALWVGFAHDATSKYVPPEEVDSNDDLADDMVAIATKYADSMLDEYEERFDKRDRSPNRRTRKPTDDDPGED
jgi:hypothetical protein